MATWTNTSVPKITPDMWFPGFFVSKKKCYQNDTKIFKKHYTKNKIRPKTFPKIDVMQFLLACNWNFFEKKLEGEGNFQEKCFPSFILLTDQISLRNWLYLC